MEPIRKWECNINCVSWEHTAQLSRFSFFTFMIWLEERWKWQKLKEIPKKWLWLKWSLCQGQNSDSWRQRANTVSKPRMILKSYGAFFIWQACKKTPSENEGFSICYDRWSLSAGSVHFLHLCHIIVEHHIKLNEKARKTSR